MAGDLSTLWDRYPRQLSIISRCGICGFELLTGDRVVIVEEDGTRGRDYPFVATPIDKLKDGQPGVQYNNRYMENWDIGPERLPVDVGCHAECIAREPCTPPRTRFQTMAYSYLPHPTEIERRVRWYRSRVGPTLHGILGRRFSIPLELCEQIAAYCDVREWAAAASRAFWEKYSVTPAPQERRFDISSEIWARYVDFEGVRYVAQLTNDPGDQPASFSLLYSPTRDDGADRLYVSEDYLGIRNIFFVCSPAMPPGRHDARVWWRSLEFPPSCLFEALTDPIKLRSILLLDPGQPTLSIDTGASHLQPAWQQPQAAMEQVSRHVIFPPDLDTYLMRMTPITLNGYGTTAYAICCDSRPYTIHAHTAGERDLSFYKTEDLLDRQTSVWLYAPMAPAERVTEVWVRRWETDMYYLHHAAFILRTDQNRTLVLGPDPADPGWGSNSYTLVYRAEDEPGRIFFDISPDGIHELALEQPIPPQPAAAQPPLPQPLSPCPRHYHEDEHYFYTAATLDGVTAVTLCWATDHGIIVGLLLHYNNGRQASLGQVRLDWLREPPFTVVNPAGQMWIRFVPAPDGCPNVHAIGFGPPPLAERAGLEYFPVAWHGTLEWWFSHRQCRLWHDHRSSPPTVRGANRGWGHRG